MTRVLAGTAVSVAHHIALPNPVAAAAVVTAQLAKKPTMPTIVREDIICFS
jgi:hypothetical protein